ncbi:MAG: hypothetical protein M0R50_03275 [Candidatus Cloacimonetes bacterium]|jgi:hypothetical protein|nr:hypothetical protein [Candidatus Cloacimonadota bacterium]
MSCKCGCGCSIPPAVKEEPKTENIQESAKVLPRSAEVDDMSIPIRTVMYVETGNLPPNEVRDIVASLTQNLHLGHPHFVVPMRNGKMNTDLDFEKGVLEFVQSICEIKDGEIALKGGCHDVDIIRVRV